MLDQNNSKITHHFLSFSRCFAFFAKCLEGVCGASPCPRHLFPSSSICPFSWRSWSFPLCFSATCRAWRCRISNRRTRCLALDSCRLRNHLNTCQSLCYFLDFSTSWAFWALRSRLWWLDLVHEARRLPDLGEGRLVDSSGYSYWPNYCCP